MPSLRKRLLGGHGSRSQGIIPLRVLFSGRFYVNKKNLMTAGLVVVSTFVLAAGSGCSDDSSTGSSSSAFSCPAVGSKACPNDPAATQESVDLCKKCETELKAYASCLGQSKATCGSDGKSQAADTTKCKTENDATTKCFTAALTGDAGG